MVYTNPFLVKAIISDFSSPSISAASGKPINSSPSFKTNGKLSAAAPLLLIAKILFPEVVRM